MSESANAVASDSALPSEPGAGDLIRQARERQGLHIAALAASMKVSQHKLELLESNRFDELPDATFVRALAHSVCRSLKIDPDPVLQRLPQPARRPDRLEVGQGLNQPFRDRDGRRDAGEGWFVSLPTLAVGFLLLAAAVVYFLPMSGIHLPSFQRESAVAPAGSASQAGATGTSTTEVTTPLFPPGSNESTVASPSVESPAGPATAAPESRGSRGEIAAAVEPAAPPVATTAPVAAPATATPAAGNAPAAAAATPASAPAAGIVAPPGSPRVSVHANEQAWVEVRDANGRALLARVLEADETVTLDAQPPLRVMLGNAPATQISYRGKPVALPVAARDRTARVELK